MHDEVFSNKILPFHENNVLYGICVLENATYNKENTWKVLPLGHINIFIIINVSYNGKHLNSFKTYLLLNIEFA